MKPSLMSGLCSSAEYSATSSIASFTCVLTCILTWERAVKALTPASQGRNVSRGFVKGERARASKNNPLLTNKYKYACAILSPFGVCISSRRESEKLRRLTDGDSRTNRTTYRRRVTPIGALEFAQAAVFINRSFVFLVLAFSRCQILSSADCRVVPAASG